MLLIYRYHYVCKVYELIMTTTTITMIIKIIMDTILEGYYSRKKTLQNGASYT